MILTFDAKKQSRKDETIQTKALVMTLRNLARGATTLIAAIVLLNGETPAQLCQNTSVGFPPLNDLGPNFWRGAQGGLYPEGQNVRPLEHNQNGINLASEVVPLDPFGNPDPVNGRIVFLSVGMSNTEQEFDKFQVELEQLQGKNPFLVTVNGAQGGWPIDEILDPTSTFWNHILGLLSQQGLRDKQVQVIWFKEADFHPGETVSDTSFEGYADTLKQKFKLAINITRSKFPNAKLCYVASRIYGGYDETLGNPEPFAYYQGWAVKYMIEDQINGDSSLGYLGPNARAPWLSWGTYLWADGIIPRSDSLTWICPDDFEPDGKHPSELGEQKVATLLLDALMADETALPWLLEGTTDATLDSSNNLPARFSSTNYPNPFNPSTTIEFDLPQQAHTQLIVYSTLGEKVESLIDEDLERGIHRVNFTPKQTSSGAYYYVLLAGNRRATGRMILLK